MAIDSHERSHVRAGRPSLFGQGPVSIAPLVGFRILFGVVMALAVVRFALKGWIHELYVKPDFFFTYPGFSWVHPPGEWGSYLLFALLFVSALGIAVGFRFRLSCILFFLSFTYVELMDQANYLNHYYFVSLISFLLCWTSAGRAWSFDARRRRQQRLTHVASWQIHVFQVQLGLVYFFAGLAKLNPDWLIQAQPLSLWLPAKAHLPLIGPLFDLRLTAYAFSWAGALFDLSIPFLLAWRCTLPWAYAAVVAFHLMTAWLFPIGIFPWVMMAATWIYFPAGWHERLLQYSRRFADKVGAMAGRIAEPERQSPSVNFFPGPVPKFLLLFFVLQLLLPFRYLLYPGKLFWNEEGYRFSWRVMLMEKAGTATFYVEDAASQKEVEVQNCDFLTANQEKMMATQPDLMLQFAHHLAETYAAEGFKQPRVRVVSHVTLNGRGSRLFVDSTLNLAAEPRNLRHKSWVLSYPYDS